MSDPSFQWNNVCSVCPNAPSHTVFLYWVFYISLSKQVNLRNIFQHSSHCLCFCESQSILHHNWLLSSSTQHIRKHVECELLTKCADTAIELQSQRCSFWCTRTNSISNHDSYPSASFYKIPQTTWLITEAHHLRKLLIQIVQMLHHT